jgi:hypothetical protein
VRTLFTGAEMAGIKFHAAIDTTICSNHIYRTCRGLWLDWMAQGTRVSGNLFHENAGEDLFVEVDHGPFIVDNNIFLSPTCLLDMSEGGAYAHNLFAGKITNRPEPDRQTPYHFAHSTSIAGFATIKGGGDRFYNNIFIGDGKPITPDHKRDLQQIRWISSAGLWGYDGREAPLETGGNVFYYAAEAAAKEMSPIVGTDHNPALKLVAQDNAFFLQLNMGPELKQKHTAIVTTALLGTAKVAGLGYENDDGSSIKINKDFFGKARSRHPTPGPFEHPVYGTLKLKVW